MRILHFSDVHLACPFREVPFADWLGKRALAAAHLVVARGRRFQDAPLKLLALARFAEEHDVDLALYTGDFTAYGADAEFALARAAFTPFLEGPPLGLVHIPGNHDIYVRDVLSQRRYENHFGDSLTTDLPEYRTGELWPIVRLFDGIAVVCVNSARPNPQPWRSSGRIPPAQLGALSRILNDERLAGRFVFVMTHYTPRLADGSPDRPLHHMVNAEAYLRTVAEIPRGALLSGHVHHTYRVRDPAVSPEIFCAGSATMESREGFWLFDVADEGVQACLGRWTGEGYVLDEASPLLLPAREAVHGT